MISYVYTALLQKPLFDRTAKISVERYFNRITGQKNQVQT